MAAFFVGNVDIFVDRLWLTGVICAFIHLLLVDSVDNSLLSRGPVAWAVDKFVGSWVLAGWVHGWR
ncbi:hypothetical protein CVV65_14205 [Kyrpidia spormannii]|uniref:Uncharacterized protein n=1 Tax=Kyrpidia spormannii TaxID=2055160 RepID=A0A2K8NBY6_9BACL|nr:hypothetical protein CVV65_14205 [Kyrpidia spormannii]